MQKDVLEKYYYNKPFDYYGLDKNFNLNYLKVVSGFLKLLIV